MRQGRTPVCTAVVRLPSIRPCLAGSLTWCGWARGAGLDDAESDGGSEGAAAGGLLQGMHEALADAAEAAADEQLPGGSRLSLCGACLSAVSGCGGGSGGGLMGDGELAVQASQQQGQLDDVESSEEQPQLAAAAARMFCDESAVEAAAAAAAETESEVPTVEAGAVAGVEDGPGAWQDDKGPLRQQDRVRRWRSAPSAMQRQWDTEEAVACEDGEMAAALAAAGAAADAEQATGGARLSVTGARLSEEGAAACG